MIIPLAAKYHGIFNADNYLVLGGIRVDLVECENGLYGVHEAVLTNKLFKEAISANKELYGVLYSAYMSLYTTSDRLNQKQINNEE